MFKISKICYHHRIQRYRLTRKQGLDWSNNFIWTHPGTNFENKEMNFKSSIHNAAYMVMHNTVVILRGDPLKWNVRWITGIYFGLVQVGSQNLCLNVLNLESQVSWKTDPWIPSCCGQILGRWGVHDLFKNMLVLSAKSDFPSFGKKSINDEILHGWRIFDWCFILTDE